MSDLVNRLRKAIARAEDGAGTLPAKEAVKLRPKDWHDVTAAGRNAADRITALEAELQKAREAALEEAAKVAEAASAEWDSDVELWIKDGMPNTAKASMHHSKAALLVAAAIRALSQDKEARG